MRTCSLGLLGRMIRVWVGLNVHSREVEGTIRCVEDANGHAAFF
jgi:hypothetical protein